MGVFKDSLFRDLKIKIIDSYINSDYNHLVRKWKDLSVGVEIICVILNRLIKDAEELCHSYTGIYINHNLYSSAVVLG